MNTSSWRAALRVARREAWRAKARSLLVIALIGLPVFVLATADIVYRTWQLSPTDKIQRAIGAADAGIQFPDCGAVQQTPHGWLDGYACGSGGPAAATPTAAELARLLQPGTRVIEERETNSEVQVRTAAGLKNTQLTGLDYADPIARGLLHQDKGRAPANVHEVALTTALAESVKLGVGDTLHVNQPSRSYRVVGVVSDASHRNTQMIYTLPAAVTPANDPGGSSSTWLIHSPGPITWTQVRQLNKAGYLVLSRSVYLNPPPKSQVTYQSGSSFAALSRDAVGVVALVGGMALLEIILLAGPAFAVGARRQRRDLALIAAVGGRRRDLRNVVLANGVVLGITAGVVSVLAAFGAAAVAVPVMRRVVDDVPGAFDPHPLELAAITLVSLLTALAAAAFPARAAARTDVVAALAGRRGQTRSRKRVPILGTALAGVGAAVAIGGATVSTGWTVILAGVVLVELGLIICTPALLGLIARAGRHLPLAPRIALRDAGRNRSAATPAVAAVMASVIGAVAIVIGVASSNDQDRRNYQPSLPGHDGYVSLDTGNNVAGRAPDVVAALRSGLPADQVLVVRGLLSSCHIGDDPCITSYANMVVPTGPDGQQTSRYRGGSLPPLIVDDGSGVNALFGTHEPAAAAALRAGNVVVVDPGAVRNGKVTIEATSDIATKSGGDKPGKARRLALPAIVVTGGYPIAQVIVPPSVAKTLGLQDVPIGVLAQTTRQPTDHEQQVVNGKLDKIDATLRLEVETGYHDPHGRLPLALIAAAGLLAVAAAVIATALANVDSRSDLVTLAAVGASPRTRRLLSMSRAAVIAGVGTAIGVVAGFVPPVAWVHASHRVASYSGNGASYGFDGRQGPVLRLVVPWLPIAIAFVAVPVVAALVAGLFSRSRLPSERHPE